MVQEKVAAYLQAVKDFKAADKQVRSIVDALDAAIKAIREHPAIKRGGWLNQYSQGPLVEKIHEPTRHMAPPTAAEINDALSRWNETRQALLSRWNSIPAEERDGLSRPGSV